MRTLWRGNEAFLVEQYCKNGKLAAVIEDVSLNEAHKELTVILFFLKSSEGQEALTSRCFTKSACSCCSNSGGFFLGKNTAAEVEYSICDSICIQEILKHSEMALEALKQDISISSFMDTEVRRTDKFATFYLEAFKKNPGALKYAPEGSVDDRDIIASAIPILGGFMCLFVASETLRLDRDLVRDAVQSEGLALKLAVAFKRNEELVKLALNQNVLSLIHASTDLMSSEAFMRDTAKRRGEKEAVMAACKQNGLLIQWATKKLRRSRQVVIAAVSKTGAALKYAPSELRNDKAFVKVLLAENGYAFHHVSDELKNDPNIALLAMSSHPDAWTSVSSSLKDHNKEVILAGIAAGKKRFSPPVPPEIKNDREIAMAAVGKCGVSIVLFDGLIQNDRAVAMAAVIQNGDALQFCAELFKNEKAFVECVVDSSPNALEHASDALRGDRELVMRALKGDGSSFCLVYTKGGLTDDKELALVAVSRANTNTGNGCHDLRFVSARLQADSDVVMASVTNNGSSLEHASYDLRNNREIVFAAVFQSKDAFQFTSIKCEFQEWVESEIEINTAYRLLLSATNNEAPMECSSLRDGSLIEQMYSVTLSDSSVESQFEILKLRAMIKRMMIVGPRLTCAVPPFVCQLFRLKGNSDVHRSIAEFVGVKTGQRLHQLRVVRKRIQLKPA